MFDQAITRLFAGAAVIATLAIAAAQPAAANANVVYSGLKSVGQANCLDERTATRQVFAEINNLRAQRGLGPLAPEQALWRAAATYAEEQADNRRLSHVGIDGSTFKERAIRAGFGGRPRAENVAWNQPSAHRVMQAWINSPSHLRAMLLPDIHLVGLGYACSPDAGHYWTMVVGR